MTLQNLRLRGRNIEYDWVEPFDAISKYAPSQSWLPGWDDFRTNLMDKIEDIVVVKKETEELLVVVGSATVGSYKESVTM